MTLEQIHSLLWWPTNQHIAKDIASFGAKLVVLNAVHRNHETGDLIYNGQLNQSYRQADHAIWMGDRRFNFTLDSPKYNIHIEDIKIGAGSLLVPNRICTARNPIWSCLNGIYSDMGSHDYFLSLRIMGYLIDCWRLKGVIEISTNEILLLFSGYSRTPHVLPKPTFESVVARNKRIITATYPRNGSGHPTIAFQYAVPDDVSFEEALEYFDQHPKNFFLSCMRLARFGSRPKFSSEFDFLDGP